jgi:hypothetical protein
MNNITLRPITQAKKHANIHFIELNAVRTTKRTGSGAFTSVIYVGYKPFHF